VKHVARSELSTTRTVRDILEKVVSRHPRSIRSNT